MPADQRLTEPHSADAFAHRFENIVVHVSQRTPHTATVPTSHMGRVGMCWRQVTTKVTGCSLTMPTVKMCLVGLTHIILGRGVQAMLETGAIHSFASPGFVDEVELHTKTVKKMV